MDHRIIVEGGAFNLRPIGLDDAGFIIEARANQPERSRFMHPIKPDLGLQIQWLQDYLKRPADYYWVIQRRSNCSAEGLIGIYDVNSQNTSAEWGRWIVLPDSFGATESALLVYRAAFEYLGLESVSCVTLADNGPAVSFQDSCGLPRTDYLPAHYKWGGRSFDAIRHTCSRQLWPEVKARLEPLAAMIARRLEGK